MISRFVSAFVGGRGAVLDDRGTIVQRGRHGDLRFAEFGEDEGSEESESLDGSEAPKSKSFWRRVYGWVLVIGSALVTLWMIGWLGWLGWRFARWIGSTLFGLSGVLGLLSGTITVLGVIALWILIGWRMRSARSEVRANERRRSFEDRSEIAGRLAMGYCPACFYPIEGSRVEEDGCTVCGECGGAWHEDLWSTYRRVEHDRVVEGMRRREIDSMVFFDARMSVCRAARALSEREVVALSSATRSWARRLLRWALILGCLGGASLIWLMLAGSVLDSNTSFAAIVFVVASGVIGVVVLVIALRSVRVWRIRSDVRRWMLGELRAKRCPCCGDDLSARRADPVDGSIVCGGGGGCGHAWDVIPRGRKHHLRRPIEKEFRKALRLGRVWEPDEFRDERTSGIPSSP